jgi:4-carboxymuconolactone decarboxylase
MKTIAARIALFLLFLSAFASVQTLAQSAAVPPSASITILRADQAPSIFGPENHFIGKVKMDTLTEPVPGSRPRVLNITFAPGARTAWHSHPLGQILIVTSGSGFIQQRGGPIQAIHEGDVIWTPPNVQHWHGAGPNGPMTHISIYDEPSGQVTQWLEQVTDAEYAKAK